MLALEASKEQDGPVSSQGEDRAEAAGTSRASYAGFQVAQGHLVISTRGHVSPRVYTCPPRTLRAFGAEMLAPSSFKLPRDL